MDDRRFDILVKSLASGTNRRTLLKGLLGLGGVAATGGALLKGDVQAARRPTPTPSLPSCPGIQVSCASGCCCPSGLHNCGPACCTEDEIPAPLPGHSECCDNACCLGTCYGEEFCCPTNQTTGGGPPAYYLCEGSNGLSCCAEGSQCCDGLCFDAESLVCCGGDVYPHSYVCCEDVPVIGDCCVDGDCDSEANCCNNECCDATCCGGIECCGNGWLCCDDQCYDPASSVCCDGTVMAGVCCSGGEGCGEGQNCCVQGEGPSAFTYCTEAPCECDRLCSDAGLDCCTINGVFAGCYNQSAEGACCTASSCEHLNEFDDCLVGACTDFACEQLSSCTAGQLCCGGTCSNTDCGDGEPGDPCLDHSQCLSAICCEGSCCAEGERCQSGSCGTSSGGGEPGDPCLDHSQCLSAICCTGRCCGDFQHCCDGICSDLECEPSTQCSSDYDCGGDIVCCVGDCCTAGQSCVTDPNNNSYCE